MSKFPETLKRLRQEKELTQPQLADALGISRSAVSMYENGNREPDFETMEAIADFFNVDMNYLYTGIHSGEYCLHIGDRPLGMFVTNSYLWKNAGLTDSDIKLISSYRIANETDKQIVDLTLQKYLEQVNAMFDVNTKSDES